MEVVDGDDIVNRTYLTRIFTGTQGSYAPKASVSRAEFVEVPGEKLSFVPEGLKEEMVVLFDKFG